MVPAEGAFDSNTFELILLDQVLSQLATGARHASYLVAPADPTPNKNWCKYQRLATPQLQ